MRELGEDLDESVENVVPPAVQNHYYQGDSQADKALETIVEQGITVVKGYIEKLSEVEQIRAQTDRYEIDKTFEFKKEELAVTSQLAGRQMTFRIVVIIAAMIMICVLAMTGYLTEGPLGIIAVIIGAALKDDVGNFIRDIFKPKEDKKE